MKKLIPILAAGLLITAFSACKEKKEVNHDNIILPKVPHEVVDTTVGAMTETENTNEVKWGGDYKIFVHREPVDSGSLPEFSTGQRLHTAPAGKGGLPAFCGDAVIHRDGPTQELHAVSHSAGIQRITAHGRPSLTANSKERKVRSRS